MNKYTYMVDCSLFEAIGTTAADLKTSGTDDEIVFTFGTPRQFKALCITNEICEADTPILIGSYDGKDFRIVLGLEINGTRVHPLRLAEMVAANPDYCLAEVKEGV